MKHAIAICAYLLATTTPLPASDEEPEAPSIKYSAPEQLKGASEADFTFQKYAPGDLLYIAPHDVNLRAAADPKAAVVATLPMATQVKVLEVASNRTTVIGKVDRWYQVEVLDAGPAKGKTGFLFGMLLTPAAFRADLDGDGELEVVTAAFAQNFKIRVRVRELGSAEPSHVKIDVDSAGGAYLGQRGGRATIKLVPKETAGLGLVEVFAHVEACADYATHWVSYTVPGAKPKLLGSAKLAMTQSGLADSPVHSSYEVTFDARRRTAKAVQTQTMDDEEGESVTKTTTQYALKNGVYVEQPQDKKQP